VVRPEGSIVSEERMIEGFVVVFAHFTTKIDFLA
jgi:hypothetical protein